MTPVERVEQELELELTFLALLSLCFVIVLPPLPPNPCHPRRESSEGLVCASRYMCHDGLRNNAKDTTNLLPPSEQGRV